MIDWPALITADRLRHVFVRWYLFPCVYLCVCSYLCCTCVCISTYLCPCLEFSWWLIIQFAQVSVCEKLRNFILQIENPSRRSPKFHFIDGWLWRLNEIRRKGILLTLRPFYPLSSNLKMLMTHLHTKLHNVVLYCTELLYVCSTSMLCP